MAASREQIIQAYSAFGWKPTSKEIAEIRKESSFWGSTVDSIAGRLINSSRFASQPKNRTNVASAFKALLGYEPTSAQLNEVMKNRDFWGTNMAGVANGIRNTPAYRDNPGIKVEQRAQDEALISNIKQGLGLTDKEISQMSRDQMQFMGQIGAQMIDNIEKSIPAPTTFNAKTFQDLYQQARENPKINQYFEAVRGRSVEDILNSVAQMQEDFEYVQTQQAQQFTRQVEGLDAEIEQAGLLYSGIREKAEDQLREQQMGVIRSTQSEARRNLQSLGRQAESQLGTQAVQSLNLQLTQPSNFGQYTNQQVQNMMSTQNVQFQGYQQGVTKSDSQIGRQQQAQVQDEYNRLQQERLLLTNPQQMT